MPWGQGYKEHGFVKSVKTCYIPQNSLLYLRKQFISQKRSYIFMLSKDWSFCHQNLQSVAILHKELKSFHSEQWAKNYTFKKNPLFQVSYSEFAEYFRNPCRSLNEPVKTCQEPIENVNNFLMFPVRTKLKFYYYCSDLRQQKH